MIVAWLLKKFICIHNRIIDGDKVIPDLSDDKWSIGIAVFVGYPFSFVLVRYEAVLSPSYWGKVRNPEIKVLHFFAAVGD